MKLQIGEKIKELRREKGVTQDQLAEMLHVSNQSVSRWELGICYPDMELLPAIANYFSVTLDELMGMHAMRSASTMNAIFTEAINHEHSGNWQAARDVLQSALKTYPENHGLMTELALVLTQTGEITEAIAISENVLENCANEKLRSTARANLCFLYKNAGMPEKALALGKSLPHIWECREMLLPGLVSGESQSETKERSFNIAYQVLRDVAAGKDIYFSLGYNAETGISGEALAGFVAHDG